MTTFWHPAYGHPDGVSWVPWFRFAGDVGYRAPGHPDGESDEPHLRHVEGLVYPMSDPTAPWFEILGSFAYPAARPGPPWFTIAPESLARYQPSGPGP